jgi:hypothetical protein
VVASGSARFAGVVTTAELVAEGASASQIRRLVRRGALMRLGYGTYAPTALVAAEAPGWAREHAVRVAAALAVTGPGAVASHHSAALIHGLDMLGRVQGEFVAVTRAPGGSSSRTGREGIRLHIAALPAWHLSVRRGTPVTSLARTVADLARASSFPAGVVVADSALRAGQVSKAELDLCLTHCAGWPGIQNARRVAAFADARSESVLESISRVTFHEHGLPPPGLQAWVGADDEIIGRADFLWRAYRTVGRLTARSSTPTRLARWPSSNGTPGYVRRASRSCTSPGRRSPGRPIRWSPRSGQRSSAAPPADRHAWLAAVDGAPAKQRSSAAPPANRYPAVRSAACPRIRSAACPRTSGLRRPAAREPPCSPRRPFPRRAGRRPSCCPRRRPP